LSLFLWHWAFIEAYWQLRTLTYIPKTRWSDTSLKVSKQTNKFNFKQVLTPLCTYMYTVRTCLLSPLLWHWAFIEAYRQLSVRALVNKSYFIRILLRLTVCELACARLYCTHTCILTKSCLEKISMNINDIPATVNYLIVFIFLLTQDFIMFSFRTHLEHSTVIDYRTIIGWFIRKSFEIFVYRKILIKFYGHSLRC
jgi:hypothetical protein